MSSDIAGQVRKFASQNGIYLKNQQKVVDLLASVMRSDSRVINVFGSPAEKSYLVVTNTAVHEVKAGLVGKGSIASIRLAEIDKLRGFRGTFNMAVYYRLEIEGSGVRIDYDFAFETPAPGMVGLNDAGLEIAEQNLGVAVEEIQRAQSAITAAKADPDLAAFNRGIAASEAEPFGERRSEPLTSAESEALVGWMRAEFEAEHYEEVWRRFLSLGFGVDGTNFSRSDYFWLNACAALSALRLGRRDHAGVPMSAGFADQFIDRGDPAQVAIEQEIRARFFNT